MKEKYDRIGTRYNLTRKADPYLLNRMYELLAPQVDKPYLDIGCGSGNYTRALFQKGVQIVGVDPSAVMLKFAREAEPAIKWLAGKAESIPLEDQSVAGALASLTIHHWDNLDKGFGELNRVIQPGGRLVLFTATPKQMEGYWLHVYFPQMLADSSQQMPAFAKVCAALENNGFGQINTEKYFVQPDLQDEFMYAPKHNPRRFMNPIFRQGVSAFADLARQEEVKSGLQKMAVDIESGKIKEIIDEFENDYGDYLFVVAEKLESN